MIGKVGVSLTSCDFSCMQKEIKRVEAADFLHLDIMDGNFVDNLTFGPRMLECLLPHTILPFNIHLMVTNPLQYINEIGLILAGEPGKHSIAVHDPSDKMIDAIIDAGCIPGVVLSINESPSYEKCKRAEFIIVMTVPPGHGGQEFMPSQLSILRSAREMFCDKCIGVDGGINDKTASAASSEGANFVISGSFVFKNPDALRLLKFAQEN